MAAKPTKVYPLEGHFLSDVPHVVTVVATRADADNLVASGAFSDNPNHPDRDRSAPDGSDEPVALARTKFMGEVGAEPQPQPEVAPPPAPTETPQDAGSSDSGAEG
jgi:hypothetical protein